MLKLNLAFLGRFNSIVHATARRTFCENMAAKTALLLIANGSEEMESVISADILRRAGVDVTIANLHDDTVATCSRGVAIRADKKFADLCDQTYDAVVLPGGLEGVKNFTASKELGSFLARHEAEKRIIAAICAAPLALKAHNIAKKAEITSYPSLKDELINDYVYKEEENVVISGNIITSKGPATTFDFALNIVQQLLDKSAAQKVAKAVLYKDYK